MCIICIVPFFFTKRFILITFNNVCVYLCVGAHRGQARVYRCPQKPRALNLPERGVTGDFEPFDVGAGS